MIFVTVGTNEAPFDRLLEEVNRLSTAEELVVQHGASSVRPSGATLHDFLPFEQMIEYVRRARVVVTHAGVGSVIVALSNGKCPVALPRLKRFGEAVDDHQLDFGRRFADAGLLTLVESGDQLERAVAHASANDVAPPGAESLANDLRQFILRKVAPLDASARARG